MSDTTSPAPSIPPGLAAPSSNEVYPSTPTSRATAIVEVIRSALQATDDSLSPAGAAGTQRADSRPEGGAVNNATKLVLHAPPINIDHQISGGDDMTQVGRGLAAWLAASIHVGMLEWVAEFREHASEHPEECVAILESFCDYLLGEPGGEGPSFDTQRRTAP